MVVHASLYQAMVIMIKKKHAVVYPMVAVMTPPDEGEPEQTPSKSGHLINDLTKDMNCRKDKPIVTLSQRENWLVISDRYNPSKILETFQDKSVMKIVGIKNYAYARPRIDKCAYGDLGNHLFHLDQDSNILYIRYSEMGGQVDVESTNTIGFYESVLKLLKHLGSTNYILITDAWPLPTPRHLYKGDKLHMNRLLTRAQKIVVNTNQSGSKKCNTDIGSRKCDTFVNMTKTIGFDQVTIKRRCVMCVYQHNVINALVAMKQVTPFCNGFTAQTIHSFLCNNVSPPLGISSEDVQMTFKNIDWLQDKGYITRVNEKLNGVYVYTVVKHNMQLYERNYPEMAAQLTKA